VSADSHWSCLTGIVIARIQSVSSRLRDKPEQRETRRAKESEKKKGPAAWRQPTLEEQCRPALVSRPTRYWMTETTLLGVNGSVGAFAPAAETSCQIAPAALVANARLPVDAGLVGTAVA
jgi:hypothetical protein